MDKELLFQPKCFPLDGFIYYDSNCKSELTAKVKNETVIKINGH